MKEIEKLKQHDAMGIWYYPQPDEIFRKVNEIIESINIPPLKGGKLIIDATDLFTGYIDSDFKNWKADEKGKPTKAMKISVMEMKEDATFAEMMSPDNLLTQDQIIYFVENFKNLLSEDGCTFFPFKSNGEVFVAGVRFRTDGRLGADVYRLSFDYVWLAEYRRRIVVPQLALEDLEPESLSSFETLSLDSRVKELEEDMRKIKKFLII